MQHPSQPDAIQQLEVRLSRLERTNRILAGLFALTLPCAGMVLGGWQGVQSKAKSKPAHTAGLQVVAAPFRAKRIELIDDSGRALMHLTAKGLEIRDPESKYKMKIGPEAVEAVGFEGKWTAKLTGKELLMQDPQNETSIFLGFLDQLTPGSASLRIGPKFSIRAQLLYSDGTGKLWLANSGVHNISLVPGQ